ncbi:MAG: class I SAM-dependent methyltransferase [Thermoflexales bacterium]|nr:class I SAM-dependent methyltransferase [Thermoflexales bacterium]
MAPLLSELLEKQRYRAIQPYLHGEVLDLGCGVAKVVALLQPGQRYVGVENQPAFLGWLKENRPEYEFHARDLDEDELGLDTRFDTILMTAVVEHLKKPDRLLSQLPQHLKPGGRVVITTPTPLGDWIHKAGARLGLFYLEAAQAHETIFTRATLQARLHRHGLSCVHYRRFLLGCNQLFVCEA